jgi:hypothetical protein
VTSPRVPPALRRALFVNLSGLAGSMCAPFWWSLKRHGDERARILHNGTICYLDTSTREIGVTANHVYERYLADLVKYGDAPIECQFGGSTIYPERHAIAQSRKWDLATFQVPQVFIAAAHLRRRTQHHPSKWPPERARVGDVVLYGGYPGILREERGETADLPFQWVSGRVNDVGEESIVLEPEFAKMEWQGDKINEDPRGMSGGPVFRLVDDTIARLELVGFIHEFSFGEAILARHADAVLADGALTEP